VAEGPRVTRRANCGRTLDPSAGSGQALHKQLPKAKPPHGKVNIVDYHGPYTGS
jgi:hypothetical protein